MKTVEISETDYKQLEQARNTINVILAKFNVHENKTKKKQSKEKVKQYLAMYGVFNKEDFKSEKELLNKFGNAFDSIGAERFESTLKRVHERNTAGKIKNIKVYALKSVEQEISKGGIPNA